MQHQIEELKEINSKLLSKIEEIQTKQKNAKKALSQEAQSKLAESRKKIEDQESEIQVLKEMVRGIKMQVRSKDTDI